MWGILLVFGVAWWAFWMFIMPAPQSAIDRQHILDEQRAQTLLMQKQLVILETIKEAKEKATP